MHRPGRLARAVLGLGAVLLALLAPGCWDYREVNQLAFLGAVGVDSAGPNVEVTELISIPTSAAGGATGGGGGGGAAASVMEVSGIGSGVANAFIKLNDILGKAASAAHARAVIFSEERARQGLEPVIDVFTRWYEFRPTIAVFVARPSAKEVMKLQSPLVRDPADFLVGLADSSPTLGFSGAIRLLDFIEGFQSYRRDAVAPLIEPVSGPELKVGAPSTGGPGGGGGGPGGGGGKPPLSALRLAGLAVFNRDRMVGTLSPSETLYWTMLAGRFRTGFVTVKDPIAPEHRIIVQLGSLRRRIGAGSRVKPSLTVDLALGGVLVEVDSGRDYTSTVARLRLQRYVTKELEKGLRRLIHRAQTEFRTDPFGFGDAYVGKFLFWDDWRRYNWLHEKFPQARVEVRMKYTQRRPGTTWAPLRTVEGELPPLEQEVMGESRGHTR